MPKCRLLFFSLLFIPLLHVSAQQLSITNGYRKIKILTGVRMEIQTKNDSIALPVKKAAGYFTVYRITANSIELRRPIAWKDTFSYAFNGFTGKDNLHKKKYYKAVAAYEYREYAIAGISKVRYSYQRNQSGEGSIGALLVPGLNIYYIWTKWWRTRIFNMKKWKFVWQ